MNAMHLASSGIDYRMSQHNLQFEGVLPSTLGALQAPSLKLISGEGTHFDAPSVISSAANLSQREFNTPLSTEASAVDSVSALQKSLSTQNALPLGSNTAQRMPAQMCNNTSSAVNCIRRCGISRSLIIIRKCRLCNSRCLLAFFHMHRQLRRLLLFRFQKRFQPRVSLAFQLFR